MDAALARLNALPRAEAEAELRACCGSNAWARAMAASRPFASRDELFEDADATWWAVSEADWLEAFRAHPRIGERKQSGVGAHATWSEQEQAGVRGADTDVLKRLAKLNREYEERFGHVFLICATGRSAQEMLAALEARLGNDPDTELRVAAEEQRRITRLRLDKLLARAA